MKSFPKPDLMKRESIAVTAFTKALVDQDAGKLAAVQSECTFGKALQIAARVTAFSRSQYARTSDTSRYNSRSNRELTNLATDEEGDEQFGGLAE